MGESDLNPFSESLTHSQQMTKGEKKIVKIEWYGAHNMKSF